MKTAYIRTWVFIVQQEEMCSSDYWNEEADALSSGKFFQDEQGGVLSRSLEFHLGVLSFSWT